MNVFLYPNSDATIYKHKDISNLNTGLDEIIELENTYSELTGHHVSRFLIGFNLEDSEIPNNILLNSEYFLNFKITDSYELKHETTFQVFPVVSPWKEGVGRRYDTEVEYEGVTWHSRTGGSDVWDEPGGVWYRYEENSAGETTDIGVEYTFSQRTSDVSLNITNIVKHWVSGNIKNNGLLVRLKDETINHQGKVAFFSKDTNTIYSPYVRIAHNDYYFDPCECLVTEKITCLYTTEASGSISGSVVPTTNCPPSGSVPTSEVIYTTNTAALISGSAEISTATSGSCQDACDSIMLRTKEIQESTIKHISSEDIVVILKGLKSKISVAETMRIKIGVRDKYPQKTFSSHSDYESNNYIDYPMYYSVRDADTHEERIPFDKYSRISCDARGHYFDFDFGCLSVGRIYEFLIRIETPSQTFIRENKIKFMVTI